MSRRTNDVPSDRELTRKELETEWAACFKMLRTDDIDVPRVEYLGQKLIEISRQDGGWAFPLPSYPSHEKRWDPLRELNEYAPKINQKVVDAMKSGPPAPLPVYRPRRQDLAAATIGFPDGPPERLEERVEAEGKQKHRRERAEYLKNRETQLQKQCEERAREGEERLKEEVRQSREVEAQKARREQRLEAEEARAEESRRAKNDELRRAKEEARRARHERAKEEEARQARHEELRVKEEEARRARHEQAKEEEARQARHEELRAKEEEARRIRNEELRAKEEERAKNEEVQRVRAEEVKYLLEYASDLRQKSEQAGKTVENRGDSETEQALSVTESPGISPAKPEL